MSLAKFIDTPVFHSLPKNEQIRLQQQSFVMALYSDILSQRIAAF